MAAFLSSHKPWCELSLPEKLSRWLAHQRYVRNAEQHYLGTHWLETITAARFDGRDQMGEPKWVYRLKYVGWGPRWNRWEGERALVVDESQLNMGRPQIVNAFWGSVSKEDRQRIPFMKVRDIVLPGPGFIEERRGVLRSILRLPEYQDYRDKQGRAESDTEMSDLEVDQPQLFAISKKPKGRRAKRHKRGVLTTNGQSTFTVKKLRLCVQQPAPSASSQIATQQEEQEQDFFQFPAGEPSFHPSVFQGTPQPASLISIGTDLDLSSSSSELVQATNRPVSMFQVNIPERGYVIRPSQNPKRRTIFEEPQYTDDGDYPMVNRTYELVRKKTVGPMWSELHPENDQQLPMHTGEPIEPIEANGTEMAAVFSYVDFEMDMNEDGTEDVPSGHNLGPPINSPLAHTILEPNQVAVSVLGATGSMILVVLSLLDLALCDDFEDLVQSIKRCPDLGLKGPYNESILVLDGWQVQDAVVGIETPDAGVIETALLGVGGPKFYRLCSGTSPTDFILFNPKLHPAWFMVPEEAQECELVLWRL